MVRAHYKDLKGHARTAKHAHNVAINQPGCVGDVADSAPKQLLNRKRAFGPQRTTRFGLCRCTLLLCNSSIFVLEKCS